MASSAAWVMSFKARYEGALLDILFVEVFAYSISSMMPKRGTKLGSLITL